MLFEAQKTLVLFEILLVSKSRWKIILAESDRIFAIAQYRKAYCPYSLDQRNPKISVLVESPLHLLSLKEIFVESLQLANRGHSNPLTLSLGRKCERAHQARVVSVGS